MRSAPQLDVFDGGCAPGCVRLDVVELQEAPFGTATAHAADEGALAPVALPDGSLDLRRDVP